MTVEYDKYGIICPHNEQCRCQVADCEVCGWNPAVKEKRLEEIREKLGGRSEDGSN